VGAGNVVVVVVWLAALIVYDIRERRLPNSLTIPGGVVILAAAAWTGRGAPAVLGALALSAAYLLVHLLDPASLGAGDVKLAIGVGALTGAFGFAVWTLAALAAPLLTAVWAIAAALRRAESNVPHGPSMCVAALAAIALAFL
jgi:leader peptidase (prepilin peptidase)/N-methyltransferase